MPKAPAKKKTESKKAAKPRAAKKAPASKPTKSSGKKLVVVESPAKAKTINRYLGSQYLVKASLGHIKDLPGKDLGVDVDQNFRPTYEPIPARAKVIQELKKAAGKASSIYLAADPDREGEAICQHLAEELGNGKPVYRILFNEITKSAIQQAVENPVEVNAKLVDAQQTRRILDRLVGYKISPLLWDKVRRGLSAGRVQTVALRFVVEREREIEAFVKEEYWTLAAQVTGAEPPPFEARLVKRNGKDLVVRGESGSGSIQAQVDQGKILIRDEAEATRIQALLEKEKYVVSATATKQVKRNPTPPFVTAKLQQDASRRLGFSAKRTMGLAQKLYEGVEIGEEGTVGLITYMRTDSTRVSDSALADARAWIGNQYGDKYLPEKPNVYRSKKGAQDAHEAIRPTSAQLSPDRVAKYVGNDEAKLYRLIWQRFVASQLRPALFDQTSIEIQAGEFGLRTTGSVLKFDGFLKVYEEATDQKDDVAEGLGRRLPEVKQGQELVLVSVAPDQHFTEPPPRYNEASLVKVLEEKGIGRPSTYASILSTIQDREYVEKVKSRFFPTELGTVVADLLVENFKELFDPAYTARMEDSLDEIEEGKQKWVEMLGDFYGKFSKDLALAGEQMADIKRMQKPTDQVCEKCTKPMVIRWGRYGSFLACSGHPDLHEHARVAQKRPGSREGRSSGGGPAGRLPELREIDGTEARPVRPVPGLLRLSGLQDHPPHRTG